MTTLAPAPIVPAADRPQLVALVTEAVVATVKADPGRDGPALDRAANAALDRVAAHIDREASYASTSVVPAAVIQACVGVACCRLKQPSSAYGTIGYDDVDPMARRAEASILADLTVDLKERWGIS